MNKSRGMALLVVLLLLALMAILSMGIHQYWQLTFPEPCMRKRLFRPNGTCWQGNSLPNSCCRKVYMTRHRSIWGSAGQCQG